MLLSVSPIHLLAALIFLAGVFFSAKSYFDYRERKIRQPFLAHKEKQEAIAKALATGEMPEELDLIEA